MSFDRNQPPIVNRKLKSLLLANKLLTRPAGNKSCLQKGYKSLNVDNNPRAVLLQVYFVILIVD